MTLALPDQTADEDRARYQFARKVARNFIRENWNNSDRGRKNLEAIATLLLVQTIRLEERLISIEQRPQTEYRGVWSAGTDYAVGDMCTSGGSLWVSLISSKGVKPGDGSAWRLAVKRGRA